MTVDDVRRRAQQVPAVVAASPTVALNDRISVGDGKQRDILVLGVIPIQAGAQPRAPRRAFLRQQDSSGRNKVGVITDKLASKLSARLTHR